MATKQPTAAEIQTKLVGRKASLSGHLAAIRGELAPLANGSGTSSHLDASEVLSVEQKVGVAFGATLLIALAFGLKSRSKNLSRAEEKGATVRLYVDYLLDEAALLVARGKDPEKALRKVLRRKAANVPVDTLNPVKEQTMFSELLSTAAKTAMIMVVEEGVERALSQARSKVKPDSSGESAA